MKEILYVLGSDYELAKRHDTVSCKQPDPDTDGKFITKTVPSARLEAISIWGNNTVTTGVLQLCNELKIPLYVNNFYGKPIGTFVPANPVPSITRLKQYETWLDLERRLHVAKAIVVKATRERLRVITKFDKHEECMDNADAIRGYMDGIATVETPNELRGKEGSIMRTFFSTFSKMLYHLPFDGRSTRPPKDEANALLSFGNVMLYNLVENEVYNSSLDPVVGFLHDPHENRASLAIDISEMFRPIIVDNLILRLDHKRTLTPSHFDKDEFKCYLDRDGKKIWMQEWKDFIASSIDYPPLQRKISVKEELRIECYNLIKYLNGEKREYKPIDFNNR